MKFFTSNLVEIEAKEIAPAHPAPLIGPNIEHMLEACDSAIGKVELRREEIEDEIRRLVSEQSRCDVALTALRAQRNAFLAGGLTPEKFHA